MYILATCNNKEDPIKNEGARVFTFPIISLWGFSRRSSAANSAVNNRIWSNFELIRDFMVVLVTCKNEEDPTLECSHQFLDVQEQLTLELVVVSCRISNSSKL